MDYWIFLNWIIRVDPLCLLAWHAGHEPTDNRAYKQPVCLPTAMIIKLGGSLPSAVIWIASGKWASSTPDQACFMLVSGI